ncbi:hypothetical protein MMC17_004182 [Xylographa soralifera]|nr:hypothetical protein [Xylographa soralifera]
MATVDGIKVNIVAKGRPLIFYNYPDVQEGSTFIDPTAQNYYIEAVEDTFFIIELSATDEWEAKSGNGLVFTFSFDGGPSFVMPMAVEERRRNGEVTGNRISGVPEYDFHTGEWHRARFSFGGLDWPDDFDSQIRASNPDERGTIKISARRAILHRQSTYARGDIEKWKSISQITEMAMKGVATLGTVNFTTSDTIDWPMHSFKETRISGADEIPVTFNIFYRYGGAENRHLHLKSLTAGAVEFETLRRMPMMLSELGQKKAIPEDECKKIVSEPVYDDIRTDVPTKWWPRGDGVSTEVGALLYRWLESQENLR